MSKRELIAKSRTAILALAAKHGAAEVRVFGSVARGEDSAASDVDFIVRFPGGATLEGICGLSDELEQLLGCKVDIISEHKDMRPHFLAECAREAMAV